MSDTTSPVDRLLEHVQAFSNDLCEDERDAGMVRTAVVVWEEMSFDEDGTPTYETLHSALGDACSPATSLGLLDYAQGKMRADLGLNV